MADLTTAFNVMNPRESWLEVEFACPHCDESLQMAVPQEVRGSEWWCSHCKRYFLFTVHNGKVKAKATLGVMAPPVVMVGTSKICAMTAYRSYVNCWKHREFTSLNMITE